MWTGSNYDWLEESRWNPRKLGFDSYCTILQHSGVPHGVLLRNDVRNTPAIDDGFRIKCQQSCAEFRTKSLIQVRPPVRCFAQCISCWQSCITFLFGAEFCIAMRMVNLAVDYSSLFIRCHSETAAFAPDLRLGCCVFRLLYFHCPSRFHLA